MSCRDDLTAFLREEAKQAFEWGRNDCFRLAGAWAERLTGAALPWPDYTTEDEAKALVDAAGGAVALAGDALERAGWKPVGEPEPGDLAIIPVTGRDGDRTEVGAIWTGRRWAVRARRGLWFGRGDALAVWRWEVMNG